MNGKVDSVLAGNKTARGAPERPQEEAGRQLCLAEHRLPQGVAAGRQLGGISAGLAGGQLGGISARLADIEQRSQR